jgi:putative protein kinase ArgK-like GTPase of G3E family
MFLVSRSSFLVQDSRLVKRETRNEKRETRNAKRQTDPQKILDGDRLSIGRAISTVEDGGPEAADLLRQIFPHTGRALVLGITGSPGAGKSTLVDRLAVHYRARGVKVGIVAVDPSCPFS